MSNHTTGRRAGLLVCAAAAVLALSGCSDGADRASGEHPAAPVAMPSEAPAATPTPSPSETPSQTPSPTPSPEPTETQTPEPEAMPASEPVSISIPAIEVDSEMMQLGLQDSGLIEVPPYHGGSPPGWYVHSPTPGEVGPSVILGHRNALEGGPGVFADLPSLEVGDIVSVTRKDGTIASFTVYRTEQVDKSVEGFPTLEVYGNTSRPELRLMTCDGLNPETGMMEHNFVAFAKLES